MSGITDLLAIIRRGDVAALEKMLAENPGLANARDDRGNSPLLIATYFGRHEMVRSLVARGARPNFFGACAVGLTEDVRRHIRENPSAARQWAPDG
jgi:uncharacterized protein